MSMNLFLHCNQSNNIHFENTQKNGKYTYIFLFLSCVAIMCTVIVRLRNKNPENHSTDKFFSLLELLVVSIYFTIIASQYCYSYNKYDKNQMLKNILFIIYVCITSIYIVIFGYFYYQKQENFQFKNFFFFKLGFELISISLFCYFFLIIFFETVFNVGFILLAILFGLIMSILLFSSFYDCIKIFKSGNYEINDFDGLKS